MLRKAKRFTRATGGVLDEYLGVLVVKKQSYRLRIPPMLRTTVTTTSGEVPPYQGVVPHPSPHPRDSLVAFLVFL